MSLIASYYDSMGESYSTADIFGSLTQSREIALKQIQQSELFKHPHHYRILDLGVGDGSFLQLMKQIVPNAELSGIDVSKEMLRIAKSRVDFHDIHCSAADADKHLPIHSQDLVIAHFISAYVPIQTLFHQAKIMSKAEGVFSFITSTYESFPESQTQIAKFVAQDSLLGNLVGHYYKTILSKTPVASGIEEIQKLCEQFNFKILEHQRIHIPIFFENVEKLAEFGIDGSWFLNTLPQTPFTKEFIIERIKRFVVKIFEFPYHDDHIIDVILLKK
jgi:ubiquinone/menaquinone biosynthesis C-methylase UbiE